MTYFSKVITEVTKLAVFVFAFLLSACNPDSTPQSTANTVSAISEGHLSPTTASMLIGTFRCDAPCMTFGRMAFNPVYEFNKSGFVDITFTSDNEKTYTIRRRYSKLDKIVQIAPSDSPIVGELFVTGICVNSDELLSPRIYCGFERAGKHWAKGPIDLKVIDGEWVARIEDNGKVDRNSAIRVERINAKLEGMFHPSSKDDSTKWMAMLPGHTGNVVYIAGNGDTYVCDLCADRPWEFMAR